MINTSLAYSVPNLLQITDDSPGWTRLNQNNTFVFLNENGEPIKEQSQLQRLQALVIPPAYGQIWICPQANGYLQVTARDDKNRKQYTYHPDWTAYQQARKFQKFAEFALELPALRQRARQHLALKGWPREKVLALAMSVLDEVGLRVGNKKYQARNQTFGLTTLRRKHLDITDSGEVVFDYKAKSSKYRKVSIQNPKLTKLIRACAELRGYEVFRYRSASGNTHAIDSADLNEYIQSLTGPNFSSKDFRTWAATTQAVELYPDALEEIKDYPSRKLEPTLVKKVAKVMGNTRSVCREYYIHPAVRQAVIDQKMPKPSDLSTEDLGMFAGELSPEEVIAYQLIIQGRGKR